jgi:homoisocitrate dehydrogenase
MLIFLFPSQGYSEPALKIYQAVDEVIRQGKALTPDLEGSATTTECQDAIINELTK